MRYKHAFVLPESDHMNQIELGIVDSLQGKVDALTAENARLRERERIAYESRNAAQERCNTAERQMADLARLTHDATAECGRLRAERDALLAAAKMMLAGHDRFCLELCADIEGPPWVGATRAAVAACAPEVKP